MAVQAVENCFICRAEFRRLRFPAESLRRWVPLLAVLLASGLQLGKNGACRNCPDFGH